MRERGSSERAKECATPPSVPWRLQGTPNRSGQVCSYLRGMLAPGGTEFYRDIRLRGGMCLDSSSHGREACLRFWGNATQTQDRSSSQTRSPQSKRALLTAQSTAIPSTAGPHIPAEHTQNRTIPEFHTYNDPSFPNRKTTDLEQSWSFQQENSSLLMIPVFQTGKLQTSNNSSLPK